MADYNNIVTAPVSVQKVARLLGTSKLSVGNLCTSDRINMWAKYKPVYLPSLNTEDQLKKNDGSEGWKNESELGSGVRPWWYGSSEMPAIKIPKMEKLSDANTPWIYNRPCGDERSPYRIGDFIWYKHYAKCVFEAVVPLSFMSENKLALDSDHSYGINYADDADKYTLTVDDVCKMNNALVNFHIATLVRVKNSMGVFTGCVASRQPINSILEFTGDDYQFHVTITTDGAISVYGDEPQGAMNSGVITTVRENDDVTICIFLININTAQIATVANLNGETLDRYSARFEDNEYIMCMKDYVVSKSAIIVVTVNCTYSVYANGNISYPSLGGYKYYIDDEDNIYEVSRFFNLSQGGTVNVTSGSQVRIASLTMGMQTMATMPDGNHVRKMPYVILGRREGVTIPAGSEGTIFALVQPSFKTVLYTSADDALNNVNGKEFNLGIPIFDKIVYNGVDAETIGVIPTANANLECFASANPASGIAIVMSSTNKSIKTI